MSLFKRKDRFNPGFILIVMLAILLTLFPIPFVPLLSAFVILTLGVRFGIYINRGISKYDIVLVVIAYLIIILGFAFPEAFNVEI